VQELDLSSLIQWTFQSVLLKKAGNGQIETTIVMSSVQAADIDGVSVQGVRSPTPIPFQQVSRSVFCT
jgi:hypothetical protein